MRCYMACSCRSQFYKLTNSHQQISSYVFDVVRSTVPKMNLDDVFIVSAWHLTGTQSAHDRVIPRCCLPQQQETVPRRQPAGLLHERSAWWKQSV